MSEAKPMSTPIAQQDDQERSTKEDIKFPYQEAVGGLMYLACKTRPDISFAMNFESRHAQQPNGQDVTNIKRTLRYLNGTKDTGILYSNKNKNKNLVEVFCDADFAGDKEG